MASVVDICNLALSKLGDEARVASIDPPDQSVQAMYCAQFYSIALNIVLDEHAWGFNTKTVQLTEVTNPNTLWGYCYALPSDFINVIAIYDYTAVNDLYGSAKSNQQSYSVETSVEGSSVIYADQQYAMLKYGAYIKDSGQFPPLFVDALAWKLAEFLAGPILKGDVGVAAAMKCMQGYQATKEKAVESDAQNRKQTTAFTPEGIAARA